VSLTFPLPIPYDSFAMRFSLRSLPLAAALAVLPLASTGCIKSTLTNGQISATKEASVALDTIGDYELARGAAQGGLVQFEGMRSSC
jgi:hypothetical protein